MLETHNDYFKNQFGNSILWTETLTGETKADMTTALNQLTTDLNAIQPQLPFNTTLSVNAFDITNDITLVVTSFDWNAPAYTICPILPDRYLNYTVCDLLRELKANPIN